MTNDQLEELVVSLEQRVKALEDLCEELKVLIHGLFAPVAGPVPNVYPSLNV
jgi:hypothetical protein